MSEVVDDLLAGIVLTRQSMQRQVEKIGEIVEKSNKTLLHLELHNNLQSPSLSTTITSPPANEDSSQSVYNLKVDCEQSIVKIVEQFHLLMQKTVDGDNNAAGSPSALDTCLVYRQRAEYLGSSVRKLVALCDTMNQLKQSLMKHEEEEALEERENTDEEF